MSNGSAPLLSLAMIVRNEAANLRACVEPVLHLVDEFVVVDTGSTDGTVAVAEELGAKVHRFNWCDDFSAARNESLRHVTGQWVLWLDADDRVDVENVRKLADLKHELESAPRVYIMTTVCTSRSPSDGRQTISHPRLFWHDPELRWTGRVHEQILPQLQGRGYECIFSDIEIEHVGYTDPALLHRKANRDLRLLRLEYATSPEDPVVLYKLGQTYMRIGQYENAVTHLLLCIKLLRGAPDWARGVYATLISALLRLNRRDEALALSGDALGLFPDDPQLLLLRSDLLVDFNELGAAERGLKRLLSLPQRPRLVFGPDYVLDRREARCTLAQIYSQQGRFEEAERQWQEVLGQHPTFITAWVGLGYMYLRQQRETNVQYVARQLQKCPDGPVYAQVLLSELASHLQQYTEALSLVDDAIAVAPNLPWARSVRSDILLKSGARREDCLSALRDVLRVSPGNLRAIELIKLLERQAQSDQPSAFYTRLTVSPGS